MSPPSSPESSKPLGSSEALPAAVRVRPAVAALTGHLRPPGDKSISHRAVLLGAMAEGTTVVTGLSIADDVADTRRCVELLGATVTEGDDGAVRISGGPGRWHAPVAPLDCGNSGTAMRLLSGVVAGCPWTSELSGDASLSARPMDRVAVPLRAMGAAVDGRGDRDLPPLVVRGGSLRGVRWEPPVASAQVKSAILLAGIQADGETVVHEPVRTRAHTEEMLVQAGADIVVDEAGPGRTVTVRRSAMRALELRVAADPSQAAFWVVGAAVIPGSRIVLEGIYPGPERSGFLNVLRRMGADLEVAVSSPPETASGGGSGVGELTVAVTSGRLVGTTVEAAEIPSLDEVPALAVAAAMAEGVTEMRDMHELRLKESDRLETVRSMLLSLGAGADLRGDDLIVQGRAGRLPGGGRVESQGDHRIAMAGLIAAMAAQIPTVVAGFASVSTSYPGFLQDLDHLCATRVWEPA